MPHNRRTPLLAPAVFAAVCLLACPGRAPAQSALDPKHQPLLAEALARRRGGDMAGAERTFREIISRQPTARGIHYEVALIRYERGDFPEAMKELSAEISLSGKTLDTENLAGALLLKMQRYEQAVQVFENACQLAPDNPVPWTNLCEAARYTGQWETADRAAEKITALKPHDTLHRLRRQTIWLALGKTAAVREEIARCREQIPYDPWVDAAATAAALATGDWATAETEWAAFAKRANPDFVDAARQDQFFAKHALAPEGSFLRKK